MRAMDIDLLRPTIEDEPPISQLPWRPRSQFLVAFFGGTLALTVIAVLNARRLRMTEAERSRMLWIGMVVGVLAPIAAGWYAAHLGYGVGTPPDDALRDTQRWLRRGQTVIALILFLLFERWQTPALRRHTTLYSDVAFASQWVAGLVAVAAAWGVSALLAIVGLLLGGAAS